MISCVFIFVLVFQYSKSAQIEHTCEEERELSALDTTLRLVLKKNFFSFMIEYFLVAIVLLLKQRHIVIYTQKLHSVDIELALKA